MFRSRRTIYVRYPGGMRTTLMNRVRVVVCGDTAVGKSSIIHRFATGEFRTKTEQTIGGSFHSQCVKTGANENLCIELWDTAGSERYRSVIPSFFRNSAAVVIVYDVTSRETFTNLEFWLNFARENAPASAMIFIAANKIDLFDKRVVTMDEGHLFYEEHECKDFVEVSAATGEGIQNLFGMLTQVPPNGKAEMEVAQSAEKEKRSCSC